MRPRDVGEVQRALRLGAPPRPPPHLPRRGHLALRPGGDATTCSSRSARSSARRACSTTAARIWTQPGVIGGHLNRLLAAHGTRIGPDPASIDAAMIGGIVANNSSGMCCGVAQNSYHTLDSLRRAARRRHARRHARSPTRTTRCAARARPSTPSSWRLRDEIRARRARSPRASARSSRPRTRAATASTPSSTTTGRPTSSPTSWSGSEGTLGFVAEITLRTVPEPPVPRHRRSSSSRSSRRRAPRSPRSPRPGRTRSRSSTRPRCARSRPSTRCPSRSSAAHAALLVELRRDGRGGARRAPWTQAQAILDALPPRSSRRASRPARRSARTCGTCARASPRAPGRCARPGTAFLTEDVAVPVARLAEAIPTARPSSSATACPTPSSSATRRTATSTSCSPRTCAARRRSSATARFMQGLVDLVVDKYDGAIKAEHGSGRNMAPFVKQGVGRAGLRRDAAREARCSTPTGS